MCPSKKIVKRSKNGILTFCSSSKLFQLVYNNLCFELYEWELRVFKAHLDDLDVSYWEQQLQCVVHQKKIPISVGTKHFIILLAKEELLELRQLLKKKKEQELLLSASDIHYEYSAN